MASLKELKNFFKSGEYDISFSWINKNDFGLINYEEEKILINIYLSIMDIFVHEFLHYKYPNLFKYSKLSEKKIEKKIKKKTKKFLNHLTVSDIKEMAKYLLKNTEWK